MSLITRKLHFDRTDLIPPRNQEINPSVVLLVESPSMIENNSTQLIYKHLPPHPNTLRRNLNTLRFDTNNLRLTLVKNASFFNSNSTDKFYHQLVQIFKKSTEEDYCTKVGLSVLDM